MRNILCMISIVILILTMTGASFAGEPMTQEQYEKDQKEMRDALGNMFKDTGDQGSLLPVTGVKKPLDVKAAGSGACPDDYQTFNANGQTQCMKCPKGYHYEFYKNEHTCVTNE